MGQGKKRRGHQRYPAEFRDEVLRVVDAQPQRSIADIANELGMPQGTLHHWVNEARERKDKATAVGQASLSETERDELMRLRKENARLSTEREILKKAAAFFAKESK
jgi:transposase